MSVFVLERPYTGPGKPVWTITECADRQDALEHINKTAGTPDCYQVIEGVRLKLEPVTQVTQYQFARGT